MSYKDVLCRRAARQEARRRRLGIESPLDSPTVVRKIRNYSQAVARWRKAGSPTRTEAEVEAIYADLCCPCTDFDKDHETCRLCGCRLRPGGKLARLLRKLVGPVANGLMAKIWMKTEHCPRPDKEKLW